MRDHSSPPAIHGVLIRAWMCALVSATYLLAVWVGEDLLIKVSFEDSWMTPPEARDFVNLLGIIPGRSASLFFVVICVPYLVMLTRFLLSTREPPMWSLQLCVIQGGILLVGIVALDTVVGRMYPLAKLSPIADPTTGLLATVSVWCVLEIISWKKGKVREH